MFDATTSQELLAQAVAGDQVALHELLLVQYQPLLEHIRYRISPQMQSMLSAEDIIQQTFVDVIRDIAHFSPRNEQSFFAWLKRIAENRVRDAVRYHKSVKRGGDRRQVHTAAPPHEDSVADLVDLLSAGSHTPSRSATRHEAVAAVQATIDALPDEYRKTVQLRLLMGKSLEETAAIMGRSPRAIQGLVDRAKKKMRAALGRLSLYE